MDRLYIVGGALLAILLAFGGGYLKGSHDGTAIEKGKWEAREAQTLRETNAKILDLTQHARAKEQSWAEELQQVSADYEKGLKDAKAKTAALLASVGKPDGVRLHDAGAACNAPGGSGTAQTPAPASGPDGGAGCELSATASRFLLDLTGEADEVARRLKACQAALLKDRG